MKYKFLFELIDIKIVNIIKLLSLFFSIALLKKTKNVLNYNNTFNIIPVSYGLNNGHIFLTLISITSILENAKNNTYYIFYIMVSNNQNEFHNKNKRKLKKIEKNYNRCKIIFIKINDKIFKYSKIKRYPVSTYYRLLLANLLPNINKIIYLDGDTIILTDLSEMINLKMENKYIMGFLDNGYKFSKIFGINTYKYITAGVILLNLKEMRLNNITNKFIEFIEKKRKLLKQEDQTVLNIVLHNKISILPAKYGLWPFFNKSQFFIHNHYLKNYTKFQCYCDDEINDAYENPGIVHYVMQKPFKKKYYLSNSTFVNYWLYYASKTEEYEKIIKYYNLSLLIKYKLTKYKNKFILTLK